MGVCNAIRGGHRVAFITQRPSFREMAEYDMRQHVFKQVNEFDHIPVHRDSYSLLVEIPSVQ